MCLIKYRSHREEELIVPNRPIRLEGLPPKHASSSPHSLEGTNSQVPRDPREHVRERTLSSGSQAVVIQQTRQSSYSNQIRRTPMAGTPGSWTDQENGFLVASHDMSQGPHRRSGSLSHGRTPRQSNASFRTTREKIIVIDGTGRKREYYKRDDSRR